MKFLSLLTTALCGLAAFSIISHAHGLEQRAQASRAHELVPNLQSAGPDGYRLSGEDFFGRPVEGTPQFSDDFVPLSVADVGFDSLAKGECAPGHIAKITQRLTDDNGQPVPGSGSMIIIRGVYGAPLYLMSYREVPEVLASRVGDPVSVCLVSVPHDCPPGDTRGRFFQVTDFRTQETWSMANSEHSCGGA
ncbi:hypothetical protein [Acidithiobacillus sulfuriphilus]|uniref:hypothetical protein n=1 Tax=Acidithiobacillus sulfuriphilus TaxID=1867749 RepID=UPI003F61CC73